MIAGSLFSALGRQDLFVLRLASRSLGAAAQPALLSLLADAAAGAEPGAAGDQQRASSLRGLTVVVTQGAAPAGCAERAATLATNCLQDSGACVRRAAVAAFKSTTVQGTPATDPSPAATHAVRHLAPLLADPDVFVSMAAAKALQQLVPRGDTAAVSAVLPLLQHQHSKVRNVAVTTIAGLAERGDEAVIEALAAASNGEFDWTVRLAVARAMPRLAERGNAQAHACLSRLLQDLNETVRKVAAGAIVHVAASPSDPFRAPGSHPLWQKRGIRRGHPSQLETPSPPRRTQRRMQRQDTNTSVKRLRTK